MRNDQFRALGLDPITLRDGLLSEVVDVAKKYAYRVDRTRIPCVSAWTKEIAQHRRARPRAPRPEDRLTSRRPARYTAP